MCARHWLSPRSGPIFLDRDLIGPMISIADRPADSPSRANFGAPSHPPTSRSPPKSRARKIEFPEPVQADLGCPVPSRKIFCFRFSEIYGFLSRIPPRKRGASRIVTNVGVGCGGRGSVGRDRDRRASQPRERDEARKTNGADAYGEVVWSWHPDAGVKFRWSRASPTGQRCAIIHGVTGARKPGPRGEREGSRENHCVGNAGCFRCLRCEYWCTYFTTPSAH